MWKWSELGGKLTVTVSSPFMFWSKKVSFTMMLLSEDWLEKYNAATPQVWCSIMYA
jgi:hypothetical protein